MINGTEEKTETVLYPLADANPVVLQKKIDDFCKDRNKEDIVTILGTTPVMVGASQFGQGMQANLQLISHCLIVWKCSKAESVSFMNQQKLLVQR